MSRSPLLLVALLAVSPAAAQTALAHAEEVEALYQSLEYEQCLESARRGLQVKGTTEVRARIELFAGLCAHGLGQSQRAAEHVTRALRLSPTISVPGYVSPKVLFFFRETQASLPPAVEPSREVARVSESGKKPAVSAKRRRSSRHERSTAASKNADSARAEGTAPVDAAADERPGATESVAKENAKADSSGAAGAEGAGVELADSAGTGVAGADSSPPSSLGSDSGDERVAARAAPTAHGTAEGPSPELANVPNAAAPVHPALDVNSEPRVERSRSPLPLYLGGGSVVALGVGLGFGAHAAATATLANDNTRFERDAHELAGAANSSMMAANVAFSLAAGAAVGAVLTYLLEPDAPQR